MTTTNTNESTASILRILSVAAGLLAAALLWPQGAAAQEGSAVARGAELYGQTCGRCHNPRPSTERTDREWATIMGHMRARANLSRTDAEALLAFLQATNGSSGSSSADRAATPSGGSPVDDSRALQAALMVLSGEEITEVSLMRALVSPLWTIGPDSAVPASGAARLPER